MIQDEEIKAEFSNPQVQQEIEAFSKWYSANSILKPKENQNEKV